MSLWHTLNHVKFLKGNPYHDAQGHFASANSSGESAGGVVKFQHKGATYTSHHAADGTVEKVNWHSAKGVPSPAYEQGQAKKVTDPMKAVLETAKGLHSEHTDMLLGVPDPSKKSSYTPGGAPDPTASTPVAKEPGPVTSLGNVGDAQAYVVPHTDGKNYYVSLENGIPKKVAEHTPGSTDGAVLFHNGQLKSPGYAGDVQTLTGKAMAFENAPPPPVATPSVSIVTDAQGNHVGAVNHITAVSPSTKVDFTNWHTKSDNEKVQTIDHFAGNLDGLLTSKEKAAKDHYQSSGYQEINGYLRSGKSYDADKIEKTASLLDSAMAKQYLPVDMTVHRGISTAASVVVGGNPENMIGQTFVHKSFVSTSYREDTAKAFGKGTVMTANLKAGTRSLPMTSYGHDEKEVVLPRNSVFRIDSVSKKGDTTHIGVTYMGALTDTSAKKAKKDDTQPKLSDKFTMQADDIVLLGPVVHDATGDTPAK